MALTFSGLVIFDAFLDGSLTAGAADKPIQATILCLLVTILVIPTQFEIATLIKNTGATVFKEVTIPASMLLTSAWYVKQLTQADQTVFHLYYLFFVIAFAVLALFVVQALRFGTNSVISNCSAGLLAIFYLGFLSGFILGIRVDFGFWELLMFVCVVKSSDIGAYTAGRLFGKHKFAPKISPGKTWEGIIGAVVFASIVALLFALNCGIMNWYSAIIFGTVFAYGGQLADLAESMIKRDAEQKDSANSVPGFGGLLDIIDSPLATAPVAYLFFMLTAQ
jgi:phosphatidate cytidylyltransferase